MITVTLSITWVIAHVLKGPLDKRREGASERKGKRKSGKGLEGKSERDLDSRPACTKEKGTEIPEVNRLIDGGC